MSDHNHSIGINSGGGPPEIESPRIMDDTEYWMIHFDGLSIDIRQDVLFEVVRQMLPHVTVLTYTRAEVAEAYSQYWHEQYGEADEVPLDAWDTLTDDDRDELMTRLAGAFMYSSVSEAVTACFDQVFPKVRPHTSRI